MDFKNKRRGFTLIEMLIVITIIALLASLILVGMGGARAKTRDSRRIADLHNVMNALELYYAKFYDYPDDSNWDGLVAALTTGDIGVTRVPKDPLSPNKTYEYGVSGDNQDYVLKATLETEDHALEEDIDGSVYGLDCGSGGSDTDSFYCIRP
ncbi:MAG: type II secretion system protein [Candidatus Pacebacteria bacterium]|nr:type II secretion system protein [Candidatus Paceibacterota bacterium]